MRLRTSHALSLCPSGPVVEGMNFLSGTPFTIDGRVVSLLADLDDWTDASEAVRTTPFTEGDIAQLIALGLVVVEGSEEAHREDDFERSWQWGLPAAAMHFSLHNRPFMSVDESEQRQVEKSCRDASPPLTRSNDDLAVISPLPEPDRRNALLGTMARRRTIRESSGAALPLSALTTMLFAGLGITGATRNAANELPLKMTPSGGARNPYEGYVYARNVEGLPPGVHHYSAAEHTLGLVSDDPETAPSELVAGQSWVDEAAALVVLVAHLDRTMWKYDDPNAYRVVMIEAGHVFQNMMLVATEAGWSACPTAAIARTPTLDTLHVPDSVVIEPIYALALMHPPNGLPPTSFDRR